VTGVPPDVAEYAAFKGATSMGFGDFFSHLPPPGAVFLGGVVLPAIDNTSPPPGVGTGTITGGPGLLRPPTAPERRQKAIWLQWRVLAACPRRT